MTESQRCPICKLGADLKRTVNLKYASLRSVIKVYSWFTAQYPRSTISINTFENHFTRAKHISKKELDALLLDGKSDKIEVKEPIKIYPLVIWENIVEIDPMLHLNNLHINTLAMIKELYEKRQDGEKNEMTLLRYISEARRQLEAMMKGRVPQVKNDDLREMINVTPMDEKKAEKELKKIEKEIG